MARLIGTVRDLGRAAGAGLQLRWKYQSAPAVSTGGLVSSAPDKVTLVDELGAFEEVLETGSYELSIDGSTKDKWTVAVPDDNAEYAVTDCITSSVTQNPSAPAGGAPTLGTGYRISGGQIQLRNITTDLWHTVFIEGAEGAEQLSFGAGEA